MPDVYHTVHIASYFRGLPTNRVFFGRKAPKCSLKTEEPPIFLELIRFDNKRSVYAFLLNFFGLNFFYALFIYLTL